MDIQFQKKEGLLATLTIKLEEKDYQTQVENEIKKIQKSVSLKGFRPGKAPVGMVKSMYGKGVLVEEINKLANKALSDYMKDNNIDILAQPMESFEKASKLDFENPKDFELSFDLGLAPEFELNVSDKDKLKLYKINLDDNDLDVEIEQLRNRYGNLEDAEIVTEKDIVYAEVTELGEDNSPLEEGVAQKPISFTPEMIEDKDLKALILNKKKGDSFVANIKTLFKNNESVISNTLGIPKEAVNDLNDAFTCIITDIKTRIPAELNEAFFKMVTGDENTVTEEDFKTKITEGIESYYKDEADQLLEFELEKLLDAKHDIVLPDVFLKRWLLESKDEEYNNENIDERYNQEAFALKRTLIREKFAKTYQIEVNAEEIKDTANAYTYGLFKNYGIPNPEINMVNQYAMNQLKEESFVNKMGDIALKRKVMTRLKEIVSLEASEISKDDFYKKVNEIKQQSLSM